MRITVLAGGLSPERDVSLSSGCLIANALKECGHECLLIDVFEGIDNIENIDKLFKNDDEYSFCVPEKEPDLNEIKKAMKEKIGHTPDLIGPNVIEVCKMSDVVFIALHGDMGENGKLQGVFDCYNIKYTGTDYTGCLLAMDKDLSKKIMVSERIPTAEWQLFNVKSDNVNDILSKMHLPVVIKPCGCGSSVGVSIVNSARELQSAIDFAAKYENLVLVEEFISGREFSVGILNGKALEPIEIIPKQGFYDYKNKYQSDLTVEICPVNLHEIQIKTMKSLAKKVHKVLRLGSYSRIDFIMKSDGNFVCLEANTLPGMTPTSLLPQEAKVDGISYNKLCEIIARNPVN